MPISYDPATDAITVTGYTEGAPCTFLDLWNADKAGTFSLHDRNGIAAADGAPVAVTNALRPTDYVILGGASGDLYVTIENWTNMTTATIRVTGIDRDGAAQTDDVVVNANGSFNTAKWFKTVTHTQVTVFTKSDAGSFDYELFQGQWGRVWKQGDLQFKLDCRRLLIGAGAATWFIDTRKQIHHIHASKPNITCASNSHFYLGTQVDATDKTSKDGCAYHWQTEPPLVDWGMALWSVWGNASDIRLSGCFLDGSGLEQQFLSTDGVNTYMDMWNCIVAGIIRPNYKIYNPASSVYNLVRLGGKYGTGGIPDGSERMVFFEQNTAALWVSLWGETLRDVIVSLGPAARLSVVDALVAADAEFINVVSDAWTFYWWNNPTEKVWRQYSFNLRVVDNTGTGIQNVNVSMDDVNGANVFSVNTDANGDIAEQIVSYGYYDAAHGDTMQPVGSYTPHTVTISKAGYPTHTIVYTMDQQREEIEKLGGAAPHGREYRRRRVPGEVSALYEYE